ncbi:MAG TPA: hypothetical protein VMT93_06170 [Gemmatimonadaceae bacterium]|nr:hypothetical protein [Gemmatimonadaceae bacterium]
MKLTRFTHAAVSLAVALAAACVTAKPELSTAPPSPDPRVGLKAGWFDAGAATWNMKLVSTTKPSKDFLDTSKPGDFGLMNSDLAFLGHYVIQGNFSGYQVWDVSNPAAPALHTAWVCPGSQSDVSVYGHLMFVSNESTNSRADCGTQGVKDTVSAERARGIRIYDITDIAHPKPVTIVQTCRGSHTHTVVSDPRDTVNIYIYVSGSAPVRSPNELAGCSAASPDADSATALFRIEVIQVPLAAPQTAHIVSSPRIFQDLAAPATHAETQADSIAAAARIAAYLKANPGRPAPAPGPRTGPTQCHDITVYPAIGLAGGACGGYGLLLDIRDPAHPKRIGAAADSNFSYWHSATFNNDGTKILFTDEWGGGLQPRCRATDKYEWGADAIFTLANDAMTFRGYYKMPAPQTQTENCVAHNGSLIPVPGRDIMVQAWYQGGISVFDFTDAAHPKEIAFFDRGPMDSTKLEGAGSWSAYWYNGLIYSSEIARGLDILDLTPSGWLSENELAAAKLVHVDFANVQDQQRIVWPAAFVVAYAYLDQLEREKGLAADQIANARKWLATEEKKSGAERRDGLNDLAAQLTKDAATAADGAKVTALASVVSELAKTK